MGRDSTKVMEIMLMQQFCQQSIKASGPLVMGMFLVSVTISIQNKKNYKSDKRVTLGIDLAN